MAAPRDTTQTSNGAGGDARPAYDQLARGLERYGHGSRVPGWTPAEDLLKLPQEVPDPATVFVPDDLRAEIEGHMAKYPDRRSAALPALAAAQQRHGWLTPGAITQVATVMRLTPAYLESVATFYDMLDTVATEPHRVYVCTNISCSLNGADALYDRFVEEADGDQDFNIRHFECLGACDIAPMASIDGVYVGPLALDDVRTVLDQVRAGRPPLPEKQIGRRMSTDPQANTREWPRPERADLATAKAGLPRRAPGQGAYGGEMPGDAPGPPAAIEQDRSEPYERETE